jgi:hypothetical protein
MPDYLLLLLPLVLFFLWPVISYEWGWWNATHPQKAG